MKKFEQLKSQYAQILENNIQEDYSDVMISCVTSDFDRLFELSWKTLKEYMQREMGITAAKTGSPKDIIKLAYAHGLIADEEQWITMMNDRNDDTHIYDYVQAVLYKSRIEFTYLPVIGGFIEQLKNLIPKEEYVVSRLPEKIEKPLCELAESFGLEKLVLFGSRARGDNHERSDVDLAVFGVKNAIAFADFCEAVDDTRIVPTLLRFDIVNMESALVGCEIRRSIMEEGVILWEAG